jgi:hypothetical protein
MGELRRLQRRRPAGARSAEGQRLHHHQPGPRGRQFIGPGQWPNPRSVLRELKAQLDAAAAALRAAGALVGELADEMRP